MNPRTLFSELKRRNIYKRLLSPTPVVGWLDRKPAFWKYGEMKTTLDLPDDLMREVKIRAVHEHKKLKDAIAELIRKGMAADKTRAPKLPKPVKLRGGFKPTTEDIEAAIAWGRD
jgi:plasmid stability protein